MIFSVFPVTLADAAVSAGGTDKNIAWHYEDGTLTIDGTGDMVNAMLTYGDSVAAYLTSIGQ